jgi:hypothetical protein
MGPVCSGNVVSYHVVSSSINLSGKVEKPPKFSDMRQGSPCGWPIACTLNVVNVEI